MKRAVSLSIFCKVKGSQLTNITPDRNPNIIVILPHDGVDYDGQASDCNPSSVDHDTDILALPDTREEWKDHKWDREEINDGYERVRRIHHLVLSGCLPATLELIW